MDVLDEQSVSIDGLATRDAWSMATAWLPQLCGRLSLVTDVDSSLFAVVPTYEWIEILMDDSVDGLAVASAVRATAIVWRALGACRGFGADENGVFWKRVCDEFRGVDAPPIDDSTRFFEKTMAFPRLTLCLPDHSASSNAVDTNTLQHAVHIACGCHEKSESVDTAHRLEEIMEILAPYVRLNAQHLTHPGEVSLKFDCALYTEDWVNELTQGINHSRSERSSNGLLTPSRITTLHRLEGEFDADEGLTYDVQVARRIVEDEFFSFSNGDTVEDFMLASLGLESDQRGGVRVLEVRLGEDLSPLIALLAALPHTTSTETLHIISNVEWTRPVDDLVWAWLGYALFHPDTPSSSWRRLSLNALHVDPGTRGREILEMMAQGNNLMTAYDPIHPLVTAYFTATFAEGAILYRVPLVDSPIIQTLDKPTQFDIGVCSTDLNGLEPWVCLVVPGVGMAWTHREFVLDITTIRAAPPSLTALRFTNWFDREEVGRQLVRVVGSSLKHLDLMGWELEPVTTTSLREIFTECPYVPSFCVRNDESLWSTEDSLAGITPQSHLNNLSLGFFASESTHLFCDAACSGSLRNLQALYLRVDAPPSALLIREAVLPTLRHLHHLRYFHWEHLPDEPMLLAYAESRAATRSAFQSLETGRDDVVVLRRLDPPTLLALMGVVRAYSSSSVALGRLSRDLVVQVATFVGTIVPRELFVTPSIN